MATQIFVNLPVRDLNRSIVFYAALGLDSKAKVDELADAALANGGSATSDPTVESFMYGRGIADPDGHQFELVHMFATPE
ncbi:MAG: hypothetical protein GEV28_40605 [Actinophytocola sp.]|uniref:VOC family protein n=1 Tax=Actinophytocola sp. TaxID=1872138 RepID=UPI0013209ED1|nr:hypothetical protein [Actinophytocola sp.]MPZ86338.1 hypothetical protein [Actinophytocola sp.]